MARIIVIDDEPYILLMLKKMLEKEGHEVEMATNGVEGSELFEQNPADLIITDIVMPEKEGLETIMDLRVKNPQLKIIAISGGGRVDSREYLNSAQLLGANKTIQKPFKKDEIIQAVRELLK
ncbi:MAG: response regulator [Chlorobi bacterium]|nr:response regulator [Chlorobiota bacterium]